MWIHDSGEYTLYFAIRFAGGSLLKDNWVVVVSKHTNNIKEEIYEVVQLCVPVTQLTHRDKQKKV